MIGFEKNKVFISSPKRVSYFLGKKKPLTLMILLPVRSLMNSFGKEPFSKLLCVDIVSLVSKIEIKVVDIYTSRKSSNQMVFQNREWPSQKNV